MQATVTIMGLYNYNKALFDDFTFPEAWTDAEKQNFVNLLLIEFAELEVIYPNWDVMKSALDSWSAVKAPNWNKLYDTTTYDYNPIYNFDRNEEITRTYKGNRNDTNNATQMNTAIEGSSGDTTTDKATAFNSNDLTTTTQTTFSPNNQSIVRGGATSEDNNEETTTARLYGNIGVTTTQQMINAEREVVKFNLEYYMLKEFKDRFCILIY